MVDRWWWDCTLRHAAASRVRSCQQDAGLDQIAAPTSFYPGSVVVVMVVALVLLLLLLPSLLILMPLPPPLRLLSLMNSVYSGPYRYWYAVSSEAGSLA